ncbi:MAG: hypothetical protein ABSD64_14485, partial [Terriglobales bacterium]
MSGRNRRFLSRSWLLLIVGSCSLHLLAQMPAAAKPTQSATANDTAAAVSSRPAASSNTELGIGDLIEIAVFGVPDLATKTRIGGSGD